MILNGNLNYDNDIKWPIALFSLILPFYFSVPFNLYIPIIGFIFSFYYVYKSLLKDYKYLILYLFLFLLQLYFLDIANYEAFFKKFSAIILFIGTYYLFKNYYSKKYDKIIFYSFFIVVLYGFYSAPAYMFNYQNYLIPGTCGENNISDLGFLRCATFGEGNYFGGYISFLILIYPRSKKFLMLGLAGLLISWAPIPFIIYFYSFIRNYIKLNAWKFIKYLLLLFIVLFILINKNYLSELFSTVSDTSSLGERFEFVRAGLAMWFDNLLIGVSFGNFGYHLSDYTLFPHLIYQIVNEEARFIPNNNLAEFLSEQGLIGLLFYVHILKKVSKISHPVFSSVELVGLLLFIGLAMPTFFQIVVAAMIGILLNKYQPLPLMKLSKLTTLSS